MKINLSLSNEVKMFLELCAGMASMQKEFGRGWKEIIQCDNKTTEFAVPIIVEDSKIWYTDAPPITPPYTRPMFYIERIHLEKFAWQWWTTPQGRRRHSINVGRGYKTSRLVWNRPRMHYYDVYTGWHNMGENPYG